MGNAAAASRVLHELLMQPQYRRVWLRHAQTNHDSQVNRAAVAAVLVYHLVDSGEVAEEAALPRRLKDRVGRALSGQTLTPQTMRWLIEAFAVTPHDEGRLWDAWGGNLPLRSHIGDLALTARGPDHRTLHLHEEHRLGPDGIPHTQETVQTIQARVEGLSGYLHRFDCADLTVDSLHGGTAGPVRPLGDGMHGVDITLDQPLAVNATATLRYRTHFRFSTPPPPQFRRAVTGRVEQVLIMVVFHPDRLPQQVWWTEWAGLSADEGILQEEPVSLSRSGDVHTVIAPLERSIVGFRWAW